MPKYLVRVQFKTDSLRAVEWARQTGDSSRWIKYQNPVFRAAMLDTFHLKSTQPVLPAPAKTPAIKPKDIPVITQPDTLNN
jgi:hypothetical protein